MRCVFFHNSLHGIKKVREADSKKLVSLPQDKLHSILGKYVDPVVLDQVKKEIADFYQ
jgi:hypothetical protein